MKNVPTFKQCFEVAEILKSMSHPQRLRMLCLLSQKEQTVSELESVTGAPQSQISQFLGRMKLEGLVRSRRESLFVFYSIADDRVRRLLKQMTGIFCDR